MFVRLKLNLGIWKIPVLTFSAYEIAVLREFFSECFHSFVHGHEGPVCD